MRDAFELSIPGALLPQVLAIGAALCGGIWLMLTRSTDRRIDEERQREAERRHYDQRIKDIEEDK